MILETVPHRFSVIDRLDPRVRVLGAILAALFPLLLTQWPTLLTALAIVLALTLHERPKLVPFTKRLATVNVFMLTLLLVLPWSVPGEVLLNLGALSYSREGLERAVLIALKGNTIVIAIMALLGTLEPVRLAHALERLKVPHKLVHLYLFTIRYIAVIEEEYRQLRRAMTIRSFRARMDGHTLRSFGYLVGMLLVRALDRSERIQAAMRCRGFTGRFHTHEHFRTSRLDAVFSVVLVAIAAAILALEMG